MVSFTIVYPDLQRLISSGSHGTLVLLCFESPLRGCMKDLKADWRRWTRAERIIAVFIASGTTALLPALFCSAIRNRLAAHGDC